MATIKKPISNKAPVTAASEANSKKEPVNHPSKATSKHTVNSSSPIGSDLAKLMDNVTETVNKSLSKDKYDNLLLDGESREQGMNVPYWVRTGIPSLDYAVGGRSHPGIPGGRIIEIYGAEGSGKSSLSVHIVKQSIEQLDTFAVYQDAECVLTDEIIEGTQLNMKRIKPQQPDTLEEAFTSQEVVLESLRSIGSTRPIVMVLDSVAACTTKSEAEADFGDSTMGIHARVMSQALRKLTNQIASQKILSIFVNQVREKIGVTWGDKQETFGGKALKFYASVRLELSRTKYLAKEGQEPFGAAISVLVKKNKVSPPHKKATFDILFIQEDEYSYPKIDQIGAILDWLKANEKIGGSEGRYEVEGKSMYKSAARELIENDPKLFDKYYEMAYSV